MKRFRARLRPVDPENFVFAGRRHSMAAATTRACRTSSVTKWPTGSRPCRTAAGIFPPRAADGAHHLPTTRRGVRLDHQAQVLKDAARSRSSDRDHGSILSYHVAWRRPRSQRSSDRARPYLPFRTGRRAPIVLRDKAEDRLRHARAHRRPLARVDRLRARIRPRRICRRIARVRRTCCHLGWQREFPWNSRTSDTSVNRVAIAKAVRHSVFMNTFNWGEAAH